MPASASPHDNSYQGPNAPVLSAFPVSLCIFFPSDRYLSAYQQRDSEYSFAIRAQPPAGPSSRRIPIDPALIPLPRDTRSPSPVNKVAGSRRKASSRAQ